MVPYHLTDMNISFIQSQVIEVILV